MSFKNKIEQIKEKAAKVAIKASAVATLMTGAGAVSSCQENNRNTDENKDKIENVEEDVKKKTMTSVVSEKWHLYLKEARPTTRVGMHTTKLKFEDGSDITINSRENIASHINPGDTVTYETDTNHIEIKDVKHKGDAEVKKKVDFGKIGKIGKDITD